LFKFLEQLSTILYLKYIFLQKELVKSLEDVGSGPIGRGPFVMKGEEEKNNEERNKEEEEALSRARESHLVVAALIATVTFAAAFTLPGGYKSDQGPNEGTAILAKKAAFIVFVISDAMSMVLSLLAVFIHFMISLIHGFKMVKAEAMDENTTGILFGYAMLLTMIAMGTMIIAFITGTYAVLEPSLGLAISTCLISLSFFFLVYLVCRFIYKNLIS
jgi:hypothetical protein